MNPQDQAYIAECRDHYQTRLRYFELQNVFKNLLAVINGDGGHRADMFGTDFEAGADAQATVLKLFGEIAELKRKLDPYKAPF